MGHFRSLFSTTQILRRVFLPRLETTRSQISRYIPTRNRTQLRLNSTTSDTEKQQLIDEQIRAPFIQLVNPDGGLDPPIRLRDALKTFERPGNYLLQVAPGAPGRAPVCRVINRKEQYQHDRAKVKDALARKRAEPKKIELNWAIDPHDLSHRLKQLANFLDKGRRVDLTLMRKKGKRRPTSEEIKHVMDRVMEGIEAANGCQVKPMDGQPGKQVLIYVKRKDT